MLRIDVPESDGVLEVDVLGASGGLVKSPGSELRSCSSPRSRGAPAGTALCSVCERTHAMRQWQGCMYHLLGLQCMCNQQV